MKDTWENFSMGMGFLILAVVVVGVIAYRAALGNADEEIRGFDFQKRKEEEK